MSEITVGFEILGHQLSAVALPDTQCKQNTEGRSFVICFYLYLLWPFCLTCASVWRETSLPKLSVLLQARGCSWGKHSICLKNSCVQSYGMTWFLLTLAGNGGYFVNSSLFDISRLLSASGTFLSWACGRWKSCGHLDGNLSFLLENILWTLSTQPIGVQGLCILRGLTPLVFANRALWVCMWPVNVSWKLCIDQNLSISAQNGQPPAIFSGLSSN